MDEIEVPRYFICPISLEIMKDPVTLTTGITYDRDSIEQWLFTNNNTTCPVTKQLLPNDNSLILTPNHTLLHIIQSWCSQKTSSSSYAIDLFQVLKLLKNLSNPRNMKKLELMIIENERNKKCLLEAGVPKAMIMFIMTCFKEGQPDKGVKEALRILQFVNIPQEEIKLLSPQHDQILDSLTWVLGCEFENSVTVKSHVVLVLKAFMKNASSRVMERLKPEFFERIVKILRRGVTLQGLKAALQVLLGACRWRRNRMLMVEAGAVCELIEIEIFGTHEKTTTELILPILFHLCSCAKGRAQLMSHKGAIAVLTKVFKSYSFHYWDYSLLTGCWPHQLMES